MISRAGSWFLDPRCVQRWKMTAPMKLYQLPNIGIKLCPCLIPIMLIPPIMMIIEYLHLE